MQDSSKNTPNSPVPVDGFEWTRLGFLFIALHVAGLTKMLQPSRLIFFDKVWIHLFGEYIVSAYTRRTSTIIFESMDNRFLLLKTAK